ncbi:uncharacterized protein [Polyergus mexicanus]|uniref:uncharacterized protein n=1 Tax=Polyergus mexicanus TaxID=615972 RepID=UPI0038B60A29
MLLDRILKQNKKKKIQRELKSYLSISVDFVRQGYGTTNNGNTARRFFEEPKKVAKILEIDVNLITKFGTILQIFSCGLEVDLDKFEKYTIETAKLYVQHYSWYKMPPAVHKVLIHGRKIMEELSISIGHLSEEAQEAKFRKQLFKEIHLINLKLNELMSNVDILIKKARYTVEPELNDDTNTAVKTLIQSFPVITEQQLILMEEWLSSSADNIHALSHQLRLIGGADLCHVIKGVMSRVISNEVEMLYSWEGARQKKAFKSLKFVQVIIGVVRLNSKTKSATESDIIEVIKNWLVRSKERSNKFQSKKKLQNTMCQTGSVCDETGSVCETVSVSEKDSVCEIGQNLND